MTGRDQQLPAAVHVQHGVNRLGKRVHYYFNYSGAEVKIHLRVWRRDKFAGWKQFSKADVDARTMGRGDRRGKMNQRWVLLPLQRVRGGRWRRTVAFQSAISPYNLNQILPPSHTISLT